MSSNKSRFDEIISECENDNSLFEDHEFPSSSCSLSLYKTLPIGNIAWWRMKDIVEKQNYTKTELLFIDKNDLISITCGKYGSPELVGALAITSQQPDLFHNTFSHQNASKYLKYGIFSFKFWLNGSWQEVVVDDRLPTDENGRLIFIVSDKGNNMLPSLLEKAYAKLLGSYEAICRCNLPEILHHFTGGVVESFDLYKCPPSYPFLTNSIFRALESNSLIGCSINIWNKETGKGVALSNGLLTCHQYIINDIREIKLVAERNEVPLTLVKLKNPWGKMSNWNGTWNVKSSEWKKLTKEDKEHMELHINSDAEFWMDFNEFIRLFDTFELCNLPTSSSLSSSSPPSSLSLSPVEGRLFRWNCQMFQGKWKKDLSVGGRPTCKDTHHTNPQYRFNLPMDSDHNGGRSCVTIIELVQKELPSVECEEERKDIGFVVYKCTKGTSFPLQRDFFEKNNFIARCDFFTNLRFVVKRIILEPGIYVVVPCTYQPNVEGSFVLRIMTSDPINSVESSEHILETTPQIVALQSDCVKDPKEEAIEKHFLDLASSDDQQISLHQMRSILNKDLKLENQAKDFSMEICKYLVSLIDKNCRTRINLLEMLYLWNVAKTWKKTFGVFDKSKQGFMNAYELKSLVLSMGYKFSPSILNQLTHRYSNEHHVIELESFIICMIRILNLHEIFKTKEKNEKMICSLEEWLELSLSIL